MIMLRVAMRGTKWTLQVSEQNRLGEVRSQQSQVKQRGVPGWGLNNLDLFMGLKCTTLCPLMMYVCKYNTFAKSIYWVKQAYIVKHGMINIICLQHTSCMRGASVCVCVCVRARVCVCVCERERDKHTWQMHNYYNIYTVLIWQKC